MQFSPGPWLRIQKWQKTFLAQRVSQCRLWLQPSVKPAAVLHNDHCGSTAPLNLGAFICFNKSFSEVTCLYSWGTHVMYIGRKSDLQKLEKTYKSWKSRKWVECGEHHTVGQHGGRCWWVCEYRWGSVVKVLLFRFRKCVCTCLEMGNISFLALKGHNGKPGLDSWGESGLAGDPWKEG
jgi:hypothetical protein